MTQHAFDGPHISIAAYRPKPGQVEALRAVVADHQTVLRGEGLVTQRNPVLMQAADGTVLEVFEWVSTAAIAAAHQNPRVQELWQRFGQACDYLPLKDLAEAQNLFAGFRPLD